MSLSAPSRRLASLCLSCNPPIHTTLAHRTRTPLTRAISSSHPRPAKFEIDIETDNPVLDEYRRKNPEGGAGAAAKKSATPAPSLTPRPGDIAASSIFEDDRRAQEQTEKELSAAEDEEGVTTVGGVRRDPNVMARVLDPNPAAREKWERKMVIRQLRKGGRLNKELFLKRTEREHLAKSHNMKTSVKKLGMVARQIAGKTLDDAIVQMRFSKKKVAVEVLAQLEAARDEAVVMRGMGLGSVGQKEAEEGVETNEKKALEIQLKDGKRHKVPDLSKIYIDQAWVGRGPYGKLPDFRARGRVFIMRTPWTSLSMVLKEEVTRVREYEEREAKRKRQLTQNVWKHLPDRPIQIQRQWYSW